MGEIRGHEPVKLIVGLIFKEDSVLKDTLSLLKRKFGEIDFESKTIPFKFTGYYEKEFGNGLSRKFISFSKLIEPQNLSAIKIFTNKLEQKFAVNKARKINIDPGYLNLAKLVLASTKDFSHRIYLNKGVFAELTLLFKDKTFKFQDWTYPDYRTSGYIEIFKQIRQIYAGQVESSHN